MRYRGVLGIRGVQGDYGTIGKGRYPHMGQTYQMKLCMSPTLLFRVDLFHVGGLVKLGFFGWSTGVSCRIWSHMCGSWYFPKFLLSERSFT